VSMVAFFGVQNVSNVAFFGVHSVNVVAFFGVQILSIVAKCTAIIRSDYETETVYVTL